MTAATPIAPPGVEVLSAARELIADPHRWTQATFARDAAGDDVASSAADAVAWCAWGALYRVCGRLADSPEEPDPCLSAAERHLIRAAVDLYDQNPEDVNDERGHPAVLEVYDLAIRDASHSSQIEDPR